jgi:hypothetical protein
MGFEPQFYEDGNLDIRCLKTGMIIRADWGNSTKKWIVVKDFIISDEATINTINTFDVFSIDKINEVLQEGYIPPITRVYRGYYMMTDSCSDEILWEKRELKVGDMVRLVDADTHGKNAYFIIGFKDDTAQLLKISLTDKTHTLISYDKNLLELVKGVDNDK